MVGIGNAAHIHKRISHTAQRRVYAHVRGFGDFFERHIAIITHNEHFALVVGQSGNDPPNVAMNLLGDKEILHIIVA